MKIQIEKRVVVLIWRIIIFKTFHIYLDTGNNIHLGDLLLGHKASIPSLSFSIVCAVATFQHVEKVFPGRCFSLTLFWKHIFNMLKRLECRKDAFNYDHFIFRNIRS